MVKLTAIELSEQLRNSLNNHVKGGHFVDPGMEELMAARLENVDGLPKALFDVGGVSALKGLLSYHEERDKVQEYQLENNVSGLIVRNVKVGNVDCSHIDFDWQLALLPSDVERLKQEVPAIVNKFLSVIDGYHLFREEGNEEIAATREDVKTAFASMGYAWISAHSTTWEIQTDGPFKGRKIGRSVERFEPDEIRISFHDAPGSFDGPSFVAVHSRGFQR